MKATIDKSGCIGCGLCAATCPEVFFMGEDGLAQARNPLAEQAITTAREAEEGCPVSVISIEE